jgi:lipopolysaccharide transport system permease protein
MLLNYIDLILYKTYADLRAETERTYLGFLWWIFEPIMFMLVFYVIFGVLLQRGSEDFVAFLLVGLITWQWLAATINHGGQTILGNRLLMLQVYLPKLIFPIILILTDSVKFIFVFSLLLLYLWFTGFPPNLTYLALPLLLLTQFLLISACTILFAVIVPFLPDLRFVVQNILQAVFFMSGIFFHAAEVVPVDYQGYFYLNPMACLIEDYRAVLMYAQWPDWSTLAIIATVSVVTLALAAWLAHYFDYLYPKITS